MLEKFLSRPEAADYVKERGLPCTKLTLGKLASVGGGPEYRTFGVRTCYTAADLDAWIESKLSAPRRSASKGATAKAA